MHSIGLASIVLVSVVLLSVPDKALEILMVIIVSTTITLLIIWRSNFDAKKDERSIQLMGFGARNSFIFLVFAMPWPAVFHWIGIIVLDTAVTLLILWILSLGIAWITFRYYYTR